MGQLGRMWDGATLTAEDANLTTTCAVMIESAAALLAVEEIAAVEGVGQLFIGPHDLSLSLGTTVPVLLDDDSAASPFARIVQAAGAYGRTVGGFAGTPEIADRFREHGITCVAVATDLWITAAGAGAALGADLSAYAAAPATTGADNSASACLVGRDDHAFGCGHAVDHLEIDARSSIIKKAPTLAQHEWVYEQ
jgi:hypothetical protein